ncbi:hypothetical protein HDK77DRAFT_478158 [Phyllosticta capitalensis]
MPAILDDPSAPTIFRQSGGAPFPDAATPLPASIVPKPVTLRDRTTKATLIPFGSADRVPLSLVEYLCAQMNSEIERGDTYPMTAPFSVEAFGRYWFQNFGAIMVLGDVADDGQEALWRWEKEGKGWEKLCLGSFYIKPNYPGRSSHVCNAGFVVTDGARNRGVGKLMGECYLEWAPLLGYTYSVFNLVYETNVASCRIWDALGFKRIGRVPGCGNLKTQPEGHFVDAIIYGRHLGYNKEDADDERRFERIKYYLLTGKYPGDADSAEKNRLRAAVRNYTLVELDDHDHDARNEPVGSAGAPGISSISTDKGTKRVKLMLGDKEVISDPRQQYEIARQFHRGGSNGSNSNNNNNAGDLQHHQHAGINKTTANVSEKYHWNRIKGTVTDVIENCAECSEKVRKKAQLKSASSSSNASAGPPPAPRTAHKSAASAATPMSSVGAGEDQQQQKQPSFASPNAAFLGGTAFDSAGPSTGALVASSHPDMSVSASAYSHSATSPHVNGFAPASSSTAVNPDPALPPPLNPPISPTTAAMQHHHDHHHQQAYQPVSQHQHDHHLYHQQNREPPSATFFFDADAAEGAAVHHHHQYPHHLPDADAYRPAWRPPNPSSPVPDDAAAAAAEANLARALAHHHHQHHQDSSGDVDPSAMALDPSILEPGADPSG